MLLAFTHTINANLGANPMKDDAETLFSLVSLLAAFLYSVSDIHEDIKDHETKRERDGVIPVRE